MRRVLFRGKRKDSGEWAHGYLFCIGEEAYICWGTVDGVPGMEEVDPGTVCQYTGLNDKNGREIFEGDILEWTRKDIVLSGGPYHDGYRFGECVKVKCLESGFTLLSPKNNDDTPNMISNVNNYDFWNMHHFLKVTGNIFDNPELLR